MLALCATFIDEIVLKLHSVISGHSIDVALEFVKANEEENVLKMRQFENEILNFCLGYKVQ